MTSNTSNSSHASTGPEVIPSIAEDEVVIARIAAGVGDVPHSGLRKLSTTSKMYDVDGNGQLDDAELAMRVMDKSNRGYLTNDKVYKLMKEQIEIQQQLFRVKRIMFILLAIVVILAISNLGTSFAAVSLAKDTTTSSNAEMIDKKTNEGLSTQSSASTYELLRSEITPEGERKLSENEGSVFTLDKRNCKQVYKQCKRGNTVTLFRMWRNGAQTDYDLCPSTAGTFSRSSKSTLLNRWGETFTIEPIGDGHCEISGGAVLQAEGNICAAGNDCAPGLGCRKVEQFITACQRRCALRRYAQHLVDQCKLDCDHPTCQAIEVEA